MTAIAQERGAVMRAKVLRSLKQGPRTTRQIAGEFNLSIAELDLILRRLLAEGRIARDPIPFEEQRFRGNSRFQWRLP